MSTRNDKILRLIDLASQRGIEIGPLDKPIAPPSSPGVLYLDHLSREALREKYAAHAEQGIVNLDKIPQIHLIDDGRPLSVLANDHAPLDFVIASHVIEHIPDPVTWLSDMALLLGPEGVVSLVVPDKRFTFDRFRSCSTTPDLVDAWIAKRRVPSYGQLYDYVANCTAIDIVAAWAGEPVEKRLLDGHTPERGITFAQHLATHGKTIDIHCFVYTPWSFTEILRELITLNLLPFEVAAFSTTERYQAEFFVTLKKSALTPAERAATVPVMDPASDHDAPHLKPAPTDDQERTQPGEHIAALKTAVPHTYLQRLKSRLRSVLARLT